MIQRAVETDVNLVALKAKLLVVVMELMMVEPMVGHWVDEKDLPKVDM